MKIDLKPHRIKCPDCSVVLGTFSDLVRHWRKAWRQPARYGKHWKPRDKAPSK